MYHTMTGGKMKRKTMSYIQSDQSVCAVTAIMNRCQNLDQRYYTRRVSSVQA
jgi:hypothetical protein